jgi:hypothetical protein
MPNNRYVIWFPEAASHLGLRWHGWAPELWGLIRQKITSTGARAAGLMRRLKALTPDQWFLVGFVLLLMAFLFVLLTQSSSVGRGGR